MIQLHDEQQQPYHACQIRAAAYADCDDRCMNVTRLLHGC